MQRGSSLKVGGVKALCPVGFGMGTEEKWPLSCSDGHSCKESNLALMAQCQDPQGSAVGASEDWQVLWAGRRDIGAGLGPGWGK